jgi:UDP-N-acetylmuramoyl-L-alanyl-D-glutamate--2,6-diaminopimelate ligase
MKTLKDILYKVAITEVIGDTSMLISQINFDSRKIASSHLFVATKGVSVDGHNFINKAIELGATAIVCEELPENINDNITYIKVKDSAYALGIIASNFYDNPSEKLKLVGVTGTNGKTSIVTILYKLFSELGNKVGMISTVENMIAGTIIPSTHTTPDAIQLNELLAKMVSESCTYCFMEVSSHAIHQHRIAGVKYVGGVLTNITHDHLDYHKTFKAYIDAKKLFFDSLQKDAFAITNADDKNGMVMLQNTGASKYTYSLKSPSDYKGKILENSFEGLVMSIDNEELHCRLIGEFNAYNLLAIYSTTRLLGVEKIQALSILSKLTSASGRFDYIVSDNEKIVGIVDYAHTPDALQKVLETIKGIRGGHETLYTLVGCGGDRDKTKRPIMAQVACDLSDRVIMTSDNPRSEEPTEIIVDMERGLNPTQKKKSICIVDRKEAIRTACMMAQKGDIILIAGKGHETYQEIKGVKYPFDDKSILTQTLKELEK